MNPEEIFQISNLMALLSWVVLIIFPLRKWSTKLVLSVPIILLAILYAFLAFSNLTLSDFDSFSTLGGVKSLFTQDLAVLTGWIHYLAFDLMVGLFILNDSRKHLLNHFIIIPCLLFTFMLGPVGLLLYFIIRTIKTKEYLHDYS